MSQSKMSMTYDFFSQKAQRKWVYNKMPLSQVVIETIRNLQDQLKLQCLDNIFAFIEALKTNITIKIEVPCGTGKSVTLCLLMLIISLVDGEKILFGVPQRTAAESLTKFINSELQKNGFPLQIACRMGGGNNKIYENECKSCSINTHGYMLQKIFGMLKRDKCKKNIIIIIDEAHNNEPETIALMIAANALQNKFPNNVKIIFATATPNELYRRINDSIKCYTFNSIKEGDKNKYTKQIITKFPVIINNTVNPFLLKDMVDKVSKQIKCYTDKVILMVVPGDKDIQIIEMMLKTLIDVNIKTISHGKERKIKNTGQSEKIVIIATYGSVRNSLTFPGCTFVIYIGCTKTNEGTYGHTNYQFRELSEDEKKQVDGRCGRDIYDVNSKVIMYTNTQHFEDSEESKNVNLEYATKIKIINLFLAGDTNPKDSDLCPNLGITQDDVKKVQKIREYLGYNDNENLNTFVKKNNVESPVMTYLLFLASQKICLNGNPDYYLYAFLCILSACISEEIHIREHNVLKVFQKLFYEDEEKISDLRNLEDEEKIRDSRNRVLVKAKTLYEKQYNKYMPDDVKQFDFNILTKKLNLMLQDKYFSKFSHSLDQSQSKDKFYTIDVFGPHKDIFGLKSNISLRNTGNLPRTVIPVSFYTTGSYTYVNSFIPCVL